MTLQLKLFFSFLLLSSSAFAEPWLANRYAQNCAACHAPGRLNVAPADRRCTLSCQGCHVNPNGGGIRNQYGAWNQKYWLYSTSPSWWRLGDGRPEISSKQDYTKPNLQNYIDNNAPKDPEKRKEFIQKIVNEGITYKTTRTNLQDQDFDRAKGAYYKETELNSAKFMAQVPKHDPLRGKRNDDVLISGGGLRYFHIEKTDNTGVKTKKDWLMSADLGVALTPIKKFTLVTEAAFANPGQTEYFQGYTQSASVRSAYAIIDDMPYNTYIMTGLYRPMFGNYDPDHNSMLSKITGLGYGAVYRATTIGLAPNIPFLNVHLFQGNSSTGSTEQLNANGYGFNLGGRWITLGASATISYFDTKSQVGGLPINRKMTSFAIGGMAKDYIPNFDIVKISRETSTAKDEGMVISLQNKYRFWRENYLMLNYGSINSSTGLKQGKASEVGFGLKSFIMPGMELEILSIQRKDTADTVGTVAGYETDNRYVQGQFHFFY